MTGYQERPWLALYDDGVPATIDYEHITLPEILTRTAERFPDTMALSFQGYRVTYRELTAMVDDCAAVLAAVGIRKGDPVAIVLPNVIPCVAAYFAILRLGAIVVMNNPLYTDRELEHQFNDSGAKALITLDLLANRMIDLRSRTGIGEIIVTSIGDYLPFPKNLLFPLVAKRRKLAADVKSAPDVHRWKDLVKHNRDAPPEATIGFDDVAMYQYTTGTTGRAKAAVLTHGNLSIQVQQVAAWFPAFKAGEEVMLGALPFFHVFGLTTVMNLAVFLGWGNILIPKPQPEPLLEAIRKFRPTFAPLVPTMYIGILNHRDLGMTDMTCFKGFFSGSAPLPVEVIRHFEEMTGAVIAEGYGLTETSPVTHINPFGGHRKAGSIGLPISDTLCKIVDVETGEVEVPVGERGELLIKGPQVMGGYKDSAEQTAEALKDGWLYTGDIATMDDEGYFCIVDRKKDLIISGGMNVCPRDIEEVLYENPKVQEACAIGIPDPTRGEGIKVFVVLRQGERADADEIIGSCKGKIATYKLPTEVEFRHELPKTSIGKILKKELKAQEMAARAQT